MKHTPKFLGSICEVLNIPCPEDQQSLEINGVATLEQATAGDLSFLSNLKYAAQAQTSSASAILVKKGSVVETKAVLIECDDPYMTFTMYLVSLEREIGGLKDQRAQALIADNAVIGNDCIIEAGAIIASGVIIGDNCRIGAGA